MKESAVKSARFPTNWRGNGQNSETEDQSESDVVSREKVVTITAPKIQCATFEIVGTAPLVIHRFSTKSLAVMLDKMEKGSQSNKNRVREPLDIQKAYNAARYISPEGWDGFNVAAIRCGLISACRLVGFKMTLAKLSLFVVADGRDKLEPEYGLIRIYGKPRLLKSVGRVETGQAYVIIRPIYDEWSAKLRIRYDADQFSETDVANLLQRLGTQVCIGEGRNDSKKSSGMGWGSFEIKSHVKTDEKRQNH